MRSFKLLRTFSTGSTKPRRIETELSLKLLNNNDNIDSCHRVHVFNHNDNIECAMIFRTPVNRTVWTQSSDVA